jgi:hypothetical protein
MRQVTSPVFFSTAEDGGVIQGLSNIPTDRPVMLVGYHMFLGLELGILVADFWKETGILLRGLAHPITVGKMYEDFVPDRAMGDPARLGGAVIVSGKAMFQLLKSGASVLLFPGGQREAGHRKVYHYHHHKQHVCDFYMCIIIMSMSYNPVSIYRQKVIVLA